MSTKKKGKKKERGRGKGGRKKREKRNNEQRVRILVCGALTFLHFRAEMYLSIQLVPSSVADTTVLAVNKPRCKEKKKKTEEEEGSRARIRLESLEIFMYLLGELLSS